VLKITQVNFDSNINYFYTDFLLEKKTKDEERNALHPHLYLVLAGRIGRRGLCGWGPQLSSPVLAAPLSHCTRSKKNFAILSREGKRPPL
jgi:hypothetical protein